MSASTWLPLLWGSGRPAAAGASVLLASRLGLPPGGCCCALRRRCLGNYRRGASPEQGLRLPASSASAAGAAATGFPRLLGTHPKKEPMEALNTAQGARDFIYSLHSTERSCLLRELHRFESIAIAQGKGGRWWSRSPPSRSPL